MAPLEVSFVSSGSMKAEAFGQACFVNLSLVDGDGIFVFGRDGDNIFGKRINLKMFSTCLCVIFELEGGSF